MSTKYIVECKGDVEKYAFPTLPKAVDFATKVGGLYNIERYVVERLFPTTHEFANIMGEHSSEECYTTPIRDQMDITIEQTNKDMDIKKVNNDVVVDALEFLLDTIVSEKDANHTRWEEKKELLGQELLLREQIELFSNGQ